MLTATVVATVNSVCVIDITHEITFVNEAGGRAYCGYGFDYKNIMVVPRVVTCLWCIARRRAV